MSTTAPTDMEAALRIARRCQETPGEFTPTFRDLARCLLASSAEVARLTALLAEMTPTDNELERVFDPRVSADWSKSGDDPVSDALGTEAGALATEPNCPAAWTVDNWRDVAADLPTTRCDRATCSRCRSPFAVEMARVRLAEGRP